MRIWACLLVIAVWIFPADAHAVPHLTDYDIASQDGVIRLTLHLSDAVEYKAFMLTNPPRAVIDIPNVWWSVPKGKAPADNTIIKELRRGVPQPKTLRIVLDLYQPGWIRDVYLVLPTQEVKYHRLVVEIAPGMQPETKPPQEAPPIPNFIKEESKPASPAVEEKKPEIPVTKAVPVKRVKPVIVIDPGHGGVDPGAISATGAHEKQLTLLYAKELEQMLNATKKFQVKITRRKDTFVPLQERVQKSRDWNADLFISLHADSHGDAELRGLSVYTLSEQASDKAVKTLSSQKTKVTKLQGLDLSANGDAAKVLIDMARRGTRNASTEFAEMLVKELGGKAPLLNNAHRFAGYKVLTGIEVPSVLVELGYLSNEEENRLLTTAKYRRKLLSAIERSITRYFGMYPVER